MVRRRSVALVALLLFVGSASLQAEAGEDDLVVRGVGFKVQKLRRGAVAFRNRKYVWKVVPARFDGWRYTQVDGGLGAAVVLKARRDTLVYAASGSAKE